MLLHIKVLFANIKIVLVVVISVVLVLIFPIFLKINIKFSKEQKLIYNIKVFNLIKVIGGKIGVLKEGIIIHLTRSRATIIEYKDIVSQKSFLLCQIRVCTIFYKPGSRHHSAR